MTWFFDLLRFLFPPRKVEVKEIEVFPITPPPAPTTPPPVIIEPMPTTTEYDWFTPAGAYKNTRKMCDDLGLSYAKNIYVKYPQGGGGYHSKKDILVACIYQESGFKHDAIGRVNSNGTRDYGLCQYNDGKLKGVPLWIGIGAAFRDIQEVLTNPKKNARIMIQTWLAGHPDWWSSYKYNDYQKHLHPKSFMWKLGV